MEEDRITGSKDIRFPEPRPQEAVYNPKATARSALLHSGF